MAGVSREPFALVGPYATPNRFENLGGPGDSRVTGQEIVKDQGLVGKLTGKVFLITGVSSGMGVETLKALALTGATIYGCARNLERAKEAIGSELISSGQVKLLHLDLTELASVRQCAAEFLKSSSVLNVLINNAAVMNTPEEKTKDGFELQLGTNHLASFLLFYLLKDVLIASSTPEFNSRLVNVSSAAHKYSKFNFDNPNFEGAYNGWAAYGSSKTANIYTTNQVDRLYGAQGVHGYSVHPGGFESENLQKHSAAEMAAMQGNERTRLYMCSLQQACATSVFGAISKTLEGKGPFYLEGASISNSVVPEDGDTIEYGYAAWAFDQANEERLWKLTKELVKVE